MMKTISKEDMVNLDQKMAEEYDISLETMLENAGKALAIHIQRVFPDAKKIAILVGSGNNGGGGLIAARHLANFGKHIRIFLSHSVQDMKKIPGEQVRVLEKMGIHMTETSTMTSEDFVNESGQYDVVIDALLGHGIEGVLRGEVQRIVECLNACAACPVVAFDTPSGFSPDTGEVHSLAVKAHSTVTLVLPKKGFTAPDAHDYIGDVYLADISVPLKWYKEQGIEESLFEKDFLIKL